MMVTEREFDISDRLFGMVVKYLICNGVGCE